MKPESFAALHAPGPRVSRKGFALLITITLLAFLVLLLVSLASLTRVETQVASNNQQLSQARQNALMALNIAIGQLQKYAGPDQRVTAAANLGKASLLGETDPVTNSIDPATTIGFNRTDSDKTGLTKAGVGTNYWTGVWGNANDVGDPTSTKNIYSANPQPVLLNWLVSGNENMLNVQLNSDGSINQPSAAAAVNYAPKAIAGVTSSSSSTDSFTFNTNNDSVLLVGSKSVNRGGSVAPGAETSYVVAPLVSINVSGSVVPGALSSGTVKLGRYAYWIGDEGIKAKYNLKDSYASYSNNLSSYAGSADYGKAASRFITSQRNGIEQFANLSSYPVNDAALSKVYDRTQVPLSVTGITSDKTNAYFHDITTLSRGVLADSLKGGLREDLSVQLSSGGTLTGPILPQVALPVIDSMHSSTGTSLKVLANGGPMNGPYWEVLRDYYESALPTGTNVITMKSASKTAAGITPVLTEVRIGNELISDGATVKLRIYPIIFLGNPYDVDLVVPSSGLDVRVAAVNNVSVNGGSVKIYNNVDSPGHTTLGSYNYISGSNSVLGGAVFRIPAGTILPAGTVQYFGLAADDPSYTPPKVEMLQLATGSSVSATKGMTYSSGVAIPSPNTAFQAIYVRPKGDGNSQILPRSGAKYGVFLIAADSTSYNLASPTQANFDSFLQSAPNIFSFPLKYTIPATGAFNVITPGARVNLGPLLIKLKDPFGIAYDQKYGVIFKYTNARMYADQNLRASVLGAGSSYSLISQLAGTQPNQNYSLYTQGGAAYQWNVNIYSTWGNLAPIDGGMSKISLFSIPKASTTGQPLISSVGQLQHANITAGADLAGGAYVPYNDNQQPGYAVGNSLAPPTVNRNLSSTYLKSATGSAPYYDISYLLNTALWDHYYFSTLPQPIPASFSPGVDSLLNNRLQFTTGVIPKASDLNSPAVPKTKSNVAAAYLFLDGAFNVNSTSVQAWAAVLSGLRNLSVSANQDSLSTPYPRSLGQTGKQAPPSSVSAALGMNSDTYTGFRALSDKEIYDPTTNSGLAISIVRQVRSRGPFVSLSHFVNRMLVSPPSTVGSGETAQTRLGLYGALQAAIELAPLYNGKTGLNTDALSTDTKADMSNKLVATGDNFGPFTEYSNLGITGGTTTNVFVDYDTVLNTGLSTGAPGWLSQADLLQPLGPVLASRSDTFVIRCYGDVLTLTEQNTPLARAWCEAVVQRYPEYVDSTDATQSPTTQAAINYGRRFKVVSFRWLSANDI